MYMYNLLPINQVTGLVSIIVHNTGVFCYNQIILIAGAIFSSNDYFVIRADTFRVYMLTSAHDVLFLYVFPLFIHHVFTKIVCCPYYLRCFTKKR